MLNATIVSPSEEPPQGLFTSNLPDARFVVVHLTPEDVAEFTALQQKAWFALDWDKKHQLKIKKPEKVLRHLELGMPLIGIRDTFNNNALVAEAMLTQPVTRDIAVNLEGYPIAKKDYATTGVIQSLCSDPETRGHNLASIVLEFAIKTAKESGIKTIIGKVADDNGASRHVFEKNGFAVASKGLDPVEHYSASYYAFDCAA